MVEMTKWIERKFNFDYPVGLFPCIVERLRGTPARLDEIVKLLSPEILTVRIDDKWSIQENIGHLIEVEALHTGRLDDYRANADVLRPADMTNKSTHRADYNSMEIDSVMSSFRKVRLDFVKQLEEMDEAAASRSARHPRLDKPMRVVDMALFAAEHDDQHIAVIMGLGRK
ncbi:MAG: DinB family protein [candidate division Zixibacteria bacterium]|nr:DinB family protein [candidate division Zixibacteria bacterium]